MNLLSCAIDATGVAVDGHSIALDPAYTEQARLAGGRLELGIRPEFVRYEPQESQGYLQAEVTHVDDLGNYKIATALLGERLVKVKVDENVTVVTGPGWLAFPRQWARLYVDGEVLR